MELEYPVEELEPLLFLFSRMIDRLLFRVRERSLAIAAIRICLTLDRKVEGQWQRHECNVRPALPSQEHSTLLKLMQLDLEMHPPQAAVIAVEVRVDSARPHRAQHGLFLPQAPEPGRLEVLLARLRKLLGENRVGAPLLEDSHRPEAFRMAAFDPPAPRLVTELPFSVRAALRVCRPPMAISVTVRAHKPSSVAMNGAKYVVVSHAGPWRSSGQWWSETNWSREEWDVELVDETTKMIGRIAYDPASNCWYMQGIYD
jgi:protein ImuB